MEKAVGVYRCPGNPPFVCILEQGKASYIGQTAYREAGHKPDFDALPWEADYRAAKQKPWREGAKT
ncbi:hypothetical protein [Mesorhizobium sp. dw_380]|uniref:hypothetical protein n=1 Tax=Mesorhizobium sp. dw_380 TaxID=2812001 RepID=UPI001BDE4F7A|nr:hypothetical protein [Mesorhizobium sp. dw_380]